MPRAAFVLLLFVFVNGYGSSGLRAEEPWEAVDRTEPRAAFNQDVRARPGLFRSAIGLVLDSYRSGQSEASISRCPFYTTCSAFLSRAVDEHGAVVGLLAFVDRYLYRENKAAFAKYSLKRRPDGVYKLDDEYFIDARE